MTTAERMGQKKKEITATSTSQKRFADNFCQSQASQEV